MYLPNYKNGSIVNLMSSIAKSFGTKTGYGELKLLPSKELNSKNIVLIVIDGLGFEYLKNKKSVFNNYMHGKITSVFLPTTACAITSFLTGEAPQQHAFTGWYMFLKEIGAVTAILPFTLRTDVPIGEYTNMKEIFNTKDFSEKIKVSNFSIMPEKILNSDFTNTTSKNSKQLGYKNLDGFFKQIKKAINYNKKRKYIYAYWAKFDSLSHKYGVNSKKTEKHFSILDKKIRRFIKDIQRTNTTLIITADHGFVDVDLKNWIKVKEHPKLKECLTMPLCGEGRTAYAYVRLSKAKQFENYIRTKLNKYCDLHKSEDLINRGMFGLGKINKKLFDRVGDYTIICKEGYLIKDFVEKKGKERIHIGHHGGVSKEEMLVPLIVAKC